jgi:hypothetical protein
LPTNRKDLFAEGVAELASERVERRECGTAVDFTTGDILEPVIDLSSVALAS